MFEQSLAEIRAEIEVNDNRTITTEHWKRVIVVPTINAAPYYGGHAVINHCAANTTRTLGTLLLPKDGGRTLEPKRLQIFIFSPATVSRNGYASGNTGTQPAFEWDGRVDGMGMKFRAWVESFKSYGAAELSTLPLSSES